MNPYPEAVRWSPDGRTVDIIDQRELPGREVILALSNAEEVAHAIRTLAVRGAPAIGIAAAMGVALEASHATSLDKPAFDRRLLDAISTLRLTRPTAVNLSWALDRMRKVEAAHAHATPGEVAC